MYVDDFDETLVCEDADEATIQEIFLPEYTVPEALELKITKLICAEKGIINTNEKSVARLFGCIAQEEKDNLIDDINNLFPIADGSQDNRPINYHKNALAYLTYYLVPNVFKIWKPLLDLLKNGCLKREARCLDIGCGPGSATIGVIEFYKALAEKFKNINFQLTISLIDSNEELLQYAKALLKSYCYEKQKNLIINFSTFSKKVDRNISFVEYGTFDLIYASNFFAIGEGKRKPESLEIMLNILKALSKDGAFIIVEPGDERNSKQLMLLRNEICNQSMANEFAPCCNIWDKSSNINCSCFGGMRCYINEPLIYKELRKYSLRKYRRRSVPFCYKIFRTDGRTKFRYEPNQKPYVKLVDLGEHIGELINIVAMVAAVISNEQDKITLKLCDGSRNDSNVYCEIKRAVLDEMNFCSDIIGGEKLFLNHVEVASAKNLFARAGETIGKISY